MAYLSTCLPVCLSVFDICWTDPRSLILVGKVNCSRLLAKSWHRFTRVFQRVQVKAGQHSRRHGLHGRGYQQICTARQPGDQRIRNNAPHRQRWPRSPLASLSRLQEVHQTSEPFFLLALFKWSFGHLWSLESRRRQCSFCKRRAWKLIPRRTGTS